MTIKPPKCKTCGAEEWRHTCRGVSKAKLRVHAIEQRKTSKLGEKINRSKKPSKARALPR